MRKIIAITLILALLALVGCSTTLPVNATSNPVGTKVGESTGMYLFNCIPLFGADSGIQKAAKNGNIKNISTELFAPDRYLEKIQYLYGPI